MKSLRETREYRCLLVSTDAEAARAGTDRQTDRQTTTVTLAHARRGLLYSLTTFYQQVTCCHGSLSHFTFYLLHALTYQLAKLCSSLHCSQSPMV